ncbi:MAG: serine O-acetyltransferase EpsC [Eubacteriales bacterium]|nr:serine O-acetyltransferase EpsC [Eubacteriales bacterium]
MKEKKEELSQMVTSILKSYGQHDIICNIDSTNRLNRKTIVELIDAIRYVLFPGYFEMRNLKSCSVEYHVGELLEEIQYRLKKEVVRALQHRISEEEMRLEMIEAEAEEIVTRFLKKIPQIRDVLATDVQAAYDGDPAAYNTDEIIVSYPGFYAITVYRIAHELYLSGVPLIPRIMTEHAHNRTGIDIHPGATIGKYFFIDHGTGVVIGETTVIGDYVKIYQGVTLGALSTRGGQKLRSKKRHPTIEDNVTVYSGASILGGETRVGEGAVIGSNAFITSSVPDQTRVSIKNPELLFKGRVQMAELGQEGFWKNEKE